MKKCVEIFRKMECESPKHHVNLRVVSQCQPPRENKALLRIMVVDNLLHQTTSLIKPHFLAGVAFLNSHENWSFAGPKSSWNSGWFGDRAKKITTMATPARTPKSLVKSTKDCETLWWFYWVDKVDYAGLNFCFNTTNGVVLLWTKAEIAWALSILGWSLVSQRHEDYWGTRGLWKFHQYPEGWTTYPSDRQDHSNKHI